MYKLFLCLRYLVRRKIVIIPILAVMLCVAMDLIVTSVMGGFLDTIRLSARGLFGDLNISSHSATGFGYYDLYKDGQGRTHDGLLQHLYRVPEVDKATPVVETYAILRTADPHYNSFTRVIEGLVGIVDAEQAARAGRRLDQFAEVTGFAEGLYWQKERPGQASIESSDPFLAGELEATAKLRDKVTWTGLPSLSSIPATAPDQPPTPLSAVVAGDPVGLIVGVRVFFPQPDDKGLYQRSRFPPPGLPLHGGATNGMRVNLTMLPLRPGSAAIPESPPMRQFYVVDTSHTKIQQIDRSFAYAPFDRLQEYLEMTASESPVDGFLAPARASRVMVKLRPGVDPKAGFESVRKAVEQWRADRERLYVAESAIVGPPCPGCNQRLTLAPGTSKCTACGRGLTDEEIASLSERLARLTRSRNLFEPASVTVTTWDQENQEYTGAIENQKVIVIFMVGVVSLTAIALIWVIFIMIVIEKTKDIGIIKSVGGSATGVAAIFIGWAGVIGAIGTALGAAVAYVFVRHINGIEQWLSGVLGTKIWDPRAYLFEAIPARFSWTEAGVIAVLAVVAAAVGALLPALRAGSMNPIEALRYE